MKTKVSTILVIIALVAMAAIIGPAFTPAIAADTPPAPDLMFPPSGTTTDDRTITLGWYMTDDAEKYLLQVDNNSDFSSPEIETYTVEPQFTPKVPFSGDTYYWRVKVIDNVNRESKWSEVWNITIYTPAIGVTTIMAASDLGVQPKQQHKDTRMLCLGGCPLTGEARWDVDHVIRRNVHDDMYCTRATISMINAYFGGGLSQDRISYRAFGGGPPEDDLHHGRGLWPHTNNVFSWALNDATVIQQMGKPTFEQIKGWIDASRPILVVRPVNGGLHCVVIDGYHEDLLGLIDWIHVVDPGPGSESNFLYITYPFERVYIPEAGAGARSDEASLSQDSDGDGVVDFDEINRFSTDPNKVDSDGDGIQDKAEIRCYTFLSDGSFDSSDIRKPDPDGDGLRAERDKDSDDGGVHDGCEDINKNGVVDSEETDPLNKDDDQMGLDLIFVIDTTGSMWDDIANVKASATTIVNEIDTSMPNYRIAVVDYRDFPVYPYGGSGDYPFHDDLSLSTDKSSIIASIQGLTLGWGADWRESVYSALMHSIDATSLGGWRGECAAKTIILMGDAPPHDPEPFTGYTLSSVVTAAENADPVIIYPIQIGGTVEKFEELADQTGGKAFTAENAGEVVAAILEALEEIKTKPVADANGPYTGYVGSPITFDGTGSYDLDGTIISYEWDLDDDGEFDDATGSTPTKTWDAPYSGIISLRVTDDDGATAIDSTTLTVRAIANQPPVADANGPYKDFIGEPITFDGTGSYDPDGTIVSYEWDLDDDGEFDDAIGPTPTKIWDIPYSGAISLKVTDNNGAMDTDSTILTVVIPATIDFDPDALNLRSKGKWVTTYIELPEGYSVSDIDVNTILFNDQAQAEMKPIELGDYDDDSIADLMAKFNRADVQELLEAGYEVVITVKGELTDGSLFEGSDTIRVLGEG